MNFSAIIIRPRLPAGAEISPLALLLAVGWAGMVAVSGCSRPDPEPEPLLVETMVVAPEPAVETARFYGRTEPQREVILSFRVPGRLHLLRAEPGLTVTENKLIAQLDQRDYEIKLRQAEAGLKQAEAQLRMLRQGARAEDLAALQSQLQSARIARRKARLNYNRHRELLAEDTVTKAEYDRARTELAAAVGKTETLEQELKKARTGGREEEIEAALAGLQTRQAGLEAAQAALDDATLTSPFTGRIARKMVDNYQNVTAGMPIAILQDTSALKVEIGLPEQMRPRAKQKVTAVRCRLDAWPERQLTGVITDLSPDADPVTRTYATTIELDIPDEIEAWPGMSAEVTIDFKTEPKGHLFIVPDTALVMDPETGKDSVWVISPDDLTATRRMVEVKAITGRGLKLEAGLSEGEIIVTAGSHFLEAGQKVRTGRD